MKRSRLLVSLVAALVGAFVLVMPSPAHADLAVSIFNNSNPIVTIQDGQSQDGSSLTGKITYTATIGNFTLNLTAETYPVLGSSTNPGLELIINSVTHTGSSSDTLKIETTQLGYGDGTGTGPNVNLPMTIGGTATGTTSGNYQAGLSSAQAMFNFDQGSTMISSLSGSSSLAPGKDFIHYSLSQFVNITMSGTSSFMGSATLGAVPSVPEPSSLVIVLASITPVLGRVALSRCRRRVAKRSV